MKNYFGTDGIRGVAGEAPLDPATVHAIGLALGEDLRAHLPAPCVVIGQDTRESGDWIVAVLSAGLRARDVAVERAGVLPTPAVAFLTATGHYAAGVMISASHNPFQDNGIKIFGPTGYKLPDAEEAEIEAAIEAELGRHPAAPTDAVESPLDPPNPALRAAYLDALLAGFAGTDFSGLNLVVDCAHGAASTVAGELFARLGAHAAIIAREPNGRNINAGVGALHPEAMAAEVVARGADAGVAFDGDADRAILADARGNIVDGDSVLLMAARDLEAAGQLTVPIVVGTVMSNLGLELALQAHGIRLERAAVGDKYVLESMRKLGAVLGGEPSGHVIFGAEATTGDGLRTALHCFDLMARRRAPLHALGDGWIRMPQRIVNVRVREKLPLDQLAPVQAAIAAANAHFGAAGRILVRYSGTEKLARVMVEAASAADVESHAQAIAQALQATIGE